MKENTVDALFALPILLVTMLAVFDTAFDLPERVSRIIHILAGAVVLSFLGVMLIAVLAYLAFAP